MKYHQVAIACGPDGFDSRSHFLKIGHAGGEDQRFALGGHIRQKWQIGELTTANLEGDHSQLFQEIDTPLVKRGGHKDDSTLAALALNLPESLERQLQLFHHLQLRFRCPRGLHLIIGFRHDGRHNPLRLERLELDNICSSSSGGIHQAQGHFHAAIVIHTGLSDDQTGQTRSHTPLTNENGIYHANIPLMVLTSRLCWVPTKAIGSALHAVTAPSWPNPARCQYRQREFRELPASCTAPRNSAEPNCGQPDRAAKDTKVH